MLKTMPEGFPVKSCITRKFKKESKLVSGFEEMDQIFELAYRKTLLLTNQINANNPDDQW